MQAKALSERDLGSRLDDILQRFVAIRDAPTYGLVDEEELTHCMSAGDTFIRKRTNREHLDDLTMDEAVEFLQPFWDEWLSVFGADQAGS